MALRKYESIFVLITGCLHVCNMCIPYKSSPWNLNERGKFTKDMLQCIYLDFTILHINIQGQSKMKT